jgi:hypothetical protein
MVVFKSLVFVLVLFIGRNVFSQEVAQKNALSVKSELFLQTLSSGQIQKAYEEALSGLVEIKRQELKNAEEQAKAAIDLYGGKILGYEFVNQKVFGNSIVEQIYILKLQENIIVWKFYYYRASNIWTLNTITFNDQMKSLD